MRVQAGTLKGRRLRSPAGDATRPSGARARAAVFDVLSHASWAPAIADSHILDAFAGSGAMAIEALSRGADRALCLDIDARARSAAQANARALGLSGRLRVLARDALSPGRRPGDFGPFDLIFLDPPYRLDIAANALAAIDGLGWLGESCLAVIESPASRPAGLPQEWLHAASRTHGAARFDFVKKA